MGLSDLCSEYISSAKLKDDTERNIIEFAEAPWGLGLGHSSDQPPLYPVQKFIFKCAYNIPLSSGDEKYIIIKDKFNEKERFRFNEIEYFNFLRDEGRINVKEITGDPNDIRPNILLVIGRRGCKTSSIAVLVAYEVYKLLKKFSPQSYYNMPTDDEINVSCIATDRKQASLLFNRIAGHLERSDFYKRYRNRSTNEYMQLSTERDIQQYGANQRPSLKIIASPCNASGLRGYNNIIAIMDEIAYFFESESSNNRSDQAVYDAVTPSVARFNSPSGEPQGRVISISSPGSRSGLFWKLYQRSLEYDCNDLLMIQAPTWEVDYTLAPKVLRAKYSENPLSYNAEFGAQFSDRISSWIENEQILRLNIIPGLRTKEQSLEQLPHFMGIDVGLKEDGTAIAICHIIKKETPSGIKNFIELDWIDVRYAVDEKKEFFQPDEIGDWIASVAAKFFIVKGSMDQYYGLAIVPKLIEKGFRQIQAVVTSRDYNSRVWQNLMSKMLDGSLRIPEGDDRIDEGKKTKDIPLISELLKLQATQHSKYMISVEAPDVKGLHDDLSDAFARAVFLATEYLSIGGGLSKQNSIQSTGSQTSYRQYYRKSKMSAYYTKRPSSSIMAEYSKNRNFGSMSPLGGRL
jgi:hypothetical protein